VRHFVSWSASGLSIRRMSTGALRHWLRPGATLAPRRRRQTRRGRLVASLRCEASARPPRCHIASGASHDAAKPRGHQLDQARARATGRVVTFPCRAARDRSPKCAGTFHRSPAPPPNHGLSFPSASVSSCTAARPSVRNCTAPITLRIEDGLGLGGVGRVQCRLALPTKSSQHPALVRKALQARFRKRAWRPVIPVESVPPGGGNTPRPSALSLRRRENPLL